jgi:hypothetical protein
MLDKLAETPYSCLLHGLWIEGAHWDIKNQVLIESTSRETITPFPMMVARACQSDLPDIEEAANDERNFVDDPLLTRKELRSEKLLAELEKKNDSRNAYDKFVDGFKSKLKMMYALPVSGLEKAAPIT